MQTTLNLELEAISVLVLHEYIGESCLPLRPRGWNKSMSNLPGQSTTVLGTYQYLILRTSTLWPHSAWTTRQIQVKSTSGLRRILTAQKGEHINILNARLTCFFSIHLGDLVTSTSQAFRQVPTGVKGACGPIKRMRTIILKNLKLTYLYIFASYKLASIKI